MLARGSLLHPPRPRADEHRKPHLHVHHHRLTPDPPAMPFSPPPRLRLL